MGVDETTQRIGDNSEFGLNFTAFVDTNVLNKVETFPTPVFESDDSPALNPYIDDTLGFQLDSTTEDFSTALLVESHTHCDIFESTPQFSELLRSEAIDGMNSTEGNKTNKAEISCELCHNCTIQVCDDEANKTMTCFCQTKPSNQDFEANQQHGIISNPDICGNASNFLGHCVCFENKRSGRGNLSFISTATNETISTNEKQRVKNFRIWEKGVLDPKTFSLILSYVFIITPIPCLLALIAAGLSAMVISQKSFVYHNKEIVISFNIFEALKCLMHMVHRMFRLYCGRQWLTWSHPYSIYFVYVALWFPDALGRITILLNCIITLDRFFALAFPIRRYQRPLISRPKLWITVVSVSMILYQMNWLILIFDQVSPNLDPASKFTSNEIITYFARAVPPTFEDYSRIVVYGGAVIRYFPLALTLIFSSLTSCSLYRHTRRRQKLISDNTATAKNRREQSRAEFTDSTTSVTSRSTAIAQGEKQKRHTIHPSNQAFTVQTNVMIVASSVIVALLASLKPLLRLLGLVIPGFGENMRELYLYRLINEICLLLDNVIPLVNLVTYNALSSQFRRRMRLLLTTACTKAPRSVSFVSEN
ncbi:hypothetical protein PoB_002258000 [Plakobranchus ocellatus]|uniref:G-protein coupled receptors family 1 profile domain-containing protein n=1 Tax=Plakobranchus ocellatus TaxID=259542 RepID=A0AAV3ZLR8_9GAST|nr:hypothetical protein PoB_002258000 [Plakobranchus ocellatus]